MLLLDHCRSFLCLVWLKMDTELSFVLQHFRIQRSTDFLPYRCMGGIASVSVEDDYRKAKELPVMLDDSS